ncbi:MAG: glutamate--tRNA ligase, partial [Acidiphilium sp.]|nr:glutamate--tRNA ligase [Acidiphilium sp.]
LSAMVLDFAKTDYSAPALHAAMVAYAEESGKKLRVVAEPLRAALTGSTISPPLDATMAVLGQFEVERRVFAVLAD